MHDGTMTLDKGCYQELNALVREESPVELHNKDNLDWDVYHLLTRFLLFRTDVI